MIVLVLPDIPTEDRLLVQARGGSQKAVLEIYDNYFTPIYQYIRLRVADAMLAEDLTSEVFLRMIDAFRKHTAPQHSLRGWLFRVARNAIYDYYGTEKKYAATTLEDWVSAPHDDEPEIQFLRTLDSEQVRQALRKLAAVQQEVLILRFGQALSLQETADIMGKSVSAIKSLQFRAVDMLRRVLAGVRDVK